MDEITILYQTQDWKTGRMGTVAHIYKDCTPLTWSDLHELPVNTKLPLCKNCLKRKAKLEQQV